MAINLVQFQTLMKRMLSLVKLVSERDRQLQRALDDGWEELLDDAEPSGTFPAPTGRQ